MATDTPTADDKSARPGKKAGLRVPPEEAFWKRYSPHGELPVSGVGSLALHAGLLIVLVTWGWLMLRLGLLGPDNRSLPVDTVALDLTRGGGGGNPNGVGDNKGIGSGVEAVVPGDKAKSGVTEPVPVRPELPTDTTKPPTDLKFDPNAEREIVRNNTVAQANYDRLDKEVRDRFRPRDNMVPGKGKGGPGSGGGKGAGEGPGEGDQSGPGGRHGRLTQREKRMLRWTMSFDTRTSEDYVNQLQGLGAILAFPVTAGPHPQYRLVRDLSRRPAQLLDEDPAKLQRIYWSDWNPQTVRGVVAVLGIHLPQKPDHFMAFMPKELEDKLFEIEKAYRGLEENQIHETRFRVRRTGDGHYEPVVVSQTPARGK